MHTPKSLSGDADDVLIAAFLINRLLSQVLGNASPITYTSILSLSPLVFGCACFVHNIHLHEGKLIQIPCFVSILVICLLRHVTNAIISLLTRYMSLGMLQSGNEHLIILHLLLGEDSIM